MADANGRGLLALVLVGVLSGIAVAISFWSVTANYREYGRLEQEVERREATLREHYEKELKAVRDEVEAAHDSSDRTLQWALATYERLSALGWTLPLPPRPKKEKSE